MSTDWRYIELGEIVDALRAYVLHPVRTVRVKRAQRRSTAEAVARFNAEVDAYLAEHPGTHRCLAEYVVQQTQWLAVYRHFATLSDKRPWLVGLPPS